MKQNLVDGWGEGCVEKSIWKKQGGVRVKGALEFE